jgi:hypothetical protein
MNRRNLDDVNGGSGDGGDANEDSFTRPDEAGSGHANGGSSGPKVGDWAVCAYDFEAESEAEQTMSEGDALVIMALHDPAGNTEWIRVKNEFGESGYVPVEFVQFR